MTVPHLLTVHCRSTPGPEASIELCRSCLELISRSCHVEAFGDGDQPRNKLVEPEPFKNVKSLSITINKAEFVSSHMAYWHLPNPWETLFTSSPFAEYSSVC